MNEQEKDVIERILYMGLCRTNYGFDIESHVVAKSLKELQEIRKYIDELRNFNTNNPYLEKLKSIASKLN